MYTLIDLCKFYPLHPIIIPNQWLVHVGAFCLGGYHSAYRLGLGVLHQEDGGGLDMALGAARQSRDEALPGGAECYLREISWF